MDSLSQIVLGGALAAAIAPGAHRRAALVAGAALATLPDLDSLPIKLLTDDPVALMTWHRSFSHSMFVLPWVGLAIWWAYRRWGRGRVAQAPTRWFWAIQLALITHPLLDAFTVYGTQLWWPLPVPPSMWSSVFIIDPLYTLWLILACAVAWFARARPVAQHVLVAGLVLSSAYLGWSLSAKVLVDRKAESSLAGMGLEQAPRFSVPMPFNTLLWRVVAMTPEGYVEGEYSLVADKGPIRFRHYPSQTASLEQVAQFQAVSRMRWFTHGFIRLREREGQLELSDLRMGAEPDYTFVFDVAKRSGQGWAEIEPVQQRLPWQARRRLGAMWERIWRQPESADELQAASATEGVSPAASASK